MRISLFLSGLLLILIGISCQETASASIHKSNSLILARLKEQLPPDTLPARAVVKSYEKIIYEKTELLTAARGTKSVLFNSTGSKLYAMNLEGLSVYEFDQPTRKIRREFKFKATKGTGWDYVNDKPIPSYEEKPVEACLSNDDKILWVSLHNAEGIVPIKIDSSSNMPGDDTTTDIQGETTRKKIILRYPGRSQKDSFYVPLIKTGKTPKIISRTIDSKYLLVSNWHSYSVSVLEINKDEYPFGKVISTIPVSSIPRGIAVDDKHNRSYVTIMGGATISVINNTAWMKVEDIPVASNPRHIVIDSAGRLYVSYNRLARIACINGLTGKTLFTAPTHAQPRTIILSKNQKFLFVTCYNSDYLDVFKVNEDHFEKVISLPCKGHPVGVDIFEDDTKLEAWVCSYTNGLIRVFSFNKK